MLDVFALPALYGCPKHRRISSGNPNRGIWQKRPIRKVGDETSEWALEVGEYLSPPILPETMNKAVLISFLDSRCSMEFFVLFAEEFWKKTTEASSH